MNTPLVHVLVINWNGLEHLEACFDSLLASPYPNAKYVLVDNASTDGSVAFVRERYGADPRVAVLECPRNLGWSGGNNFAMARALKAGAEYVFLLNNDTATAPDALEKLVAMADARPEIGALAPKMLLYYSPDLLNSVGLVCSRLGASWDKGIGRLDGPRWDTPEPVIGVCGGAWLIRTSVLQKTGLLPEEFEIYLDDLDLCLRIWNSGHEIWSCPEAVVRHKFSATLGAGARARYKYYLNTRNRLRIVLRHFPLPKAGEVLPALVLGELRAIGRSLLDGEAWRAARHLQAWCAALAYLPRAISARRQFRQAGLEAGRFWPLILRAPLFCPGLEIPEQGWYPPREVFGRSLRPMSARAWLEVPAGRLRVFHGNCYSRLGETRIRVSMGGETLAELCTSRLDETVLSVDAGHLEFESARVFTAEETGEIMDVGGWIAAEADGKAGEAGH